MPIGRGGGPDSLSTVEPSPVAPPEAPAVQVETADPAPVVTTPAVETHSEGWLFGS